MTTAREAGAARDAVTVALLAPAAPTAAQVRTALDRAARRASAAPAGGHCDNRLARLGCG